MIAIRNWLLRKLAGSSTVVLNATIRLPNGTYNSNLLVTGEKSLIRNCRFIGPGVAA